jgi:hypothetical protein
MARHQAISCAWGQFGLLANLDLNFKSICGIVLAECLYGLHQTTFRA